MTYVKLYIYDVSLTHTTITPPEWNHEVWRLLQEKYHSTPSTHTSNKEDAT